MLFVSEPNRTLWVVPVVGLSAGVLLGVLAWIAAARGPAIDGGVVGLGVLAAAIVLASVAMFRRVRATAEGVEVRSPLWRETFEPRGSAFGYRLHVAGRRTRLILYLTDGDRRIDLAQFSSARAAHPERWALRADRLFGTDGSGEARRRVEADRAAIRAWRAQIDAYHASIR